MFFLLKQNYLYYFLTIFTMAIFVKIKKKIAYVHVQGKNII